MRRWRNALDYLAPIGSGLAGWLFALTGYQILIRFLPETPEPQQVVTP